MCSAGQGGDPYGCPDYFVHDHLPLPRWVLALWKTCYHLSTKRELLTFVFLDKCVKKLIYFCLFFDMRRVSTFGEDYFAIMTAVGLVVVHDGAYLRDHWLW